MAVWTDGCFNGIRFAEGLGPGQGSREWLAEACVGVTDQPNNKSIILAIGMDTDDMCSLTDDLVLQWKNDTDAGCYADLSCTGDLTWCGPTDLICGNATVTGERMGEENCSTMGVTHGDGLEKEGANLAAISGAGSKLVIDFHWAVDLTGADAGDTYSFRIRTAVSGGGDLIATPSATLAVVQAGKIVVVSRNDDSSSTIGSVTASAFLSDEAACDPKPLSNMQGQTVTDACGAGTITGLVSGTKYFVHYYKDDTTDIADGTIEITAVDDL